MLDGCFDAPICQEDNWENIFFQQVGRDQGQIKSAASEPNEDSNDDEVEEIPVLPSFFLIGQRYLQCRML